MALCIENGHESLESRVRGNPQARFGGGLLEKCCHNGTTVTERYPSWLRPIILITLAAGVGAVVYGVSRLLRPDLPAITVFIGAYLIGALVALVFWAWLRRRKRGHIHRQ